jgi:hypothetical protein
VVCLFHGDYGPADPGFSVPAAAPSEHGWSVDASLLNGTSFLELFQPIDIMKKWFG